MPELVSWPAGLSLRSVADDEWQVVAWLWQLFRYDLARIVDGYPYRDGRYQAAALGEFPSPDGSGYLVWRPHPNTSDDTPVAFALVDGILGARRSVVAFWVAPQLRRSGIGRLLALDVLARHAGPWQIGFQHDNTIATRFWRAVADTAFGPGAWTETEEPVPGRPNVPADHFIRFG